MTSFAYSSLILATALATACATDPADPTSTGGGKADGDSASLTFNADYTQSQHGTLLAGDSLQITYALDRLTDCRSESGGSDQFGITGYAQFDDAAPITFGVSRLASGKAVPVTAEVAIPASAAHVALWFSISDVYGCIAYDSNDNANYGYAIDRHGLGAVLSFGASGAPSASAALHTGDHVVVHYAPERLADCAGSTAGHAAYSITGNWQVDGGTTHSVTVTRANGSSLEAGDPDIALPHGSDLAVWFDSSNVWGCHAYDSADGANYHFAIE
jgi:Family of unknown function (DUF6209)